MLGRLGVIHSASMRLHSIDDPEILAREIIDILGDAVPHDYAAVYLIQDDRLEPFAVSDRGLSEATIEEDKNYLRSLDLKVGSNVTGWVAMHNQSAIIKDATLDPRFLDSRPGVLSELCVPMRTGDKVTGIINLESNRRGAYTESERSVLEIIAAQLSLSIENARLKKQLAQLSQA